MGLPKAYEPADYETDIYSLWEQGGVFKADPGSPKPHFSISMPPPNETGTLHVGHALFITLQDILARRARQQGKDVLWLPGTDHAALPVNAIIEKQLAEQGTNKHQIGRDEFLKRTKEFVGDSRNTINSQVRAMGASVDWSRARYTLDDTLNRCVNETFVKMYDDGLIYRGHRIVNWDPKLETTVSDDEVVHKEEQGTFYTLQYGPFQIGTARPETKFGDKYVVMHPDDERYKQYSHGDTFEAEWINGPVKATVIKDESVDPKFGTGVMTITPWHDHTDFDIAERHGLEKDQIIDFNGKLLPIAGEFAGQPIEVARPKIVEKLKAKGLLVNEDTNYVHNLAINDRGKGLIEPQIKLQWFVDVNRPAVEWKGQLRSLKEVMRAVIEDSDIEIIPKRFEKIYYHWIDNLRDWCISRQIWWGHQIPVWYRKADGRAQSSDEEKGKTFVGTRSPDGDGWERDPDTLDTWFSSALWTWSTLINPDLAGNYDLSLEQLFEQSPDFKAYHPTSVMETGWDILFFWVARMILATTYMTGQVPFRQVYLHGLVRTEQGKKMSKSDPDSIIDPLEVIPQYGTDALRLALVSGVNAGQDQKLGVSKIVDNRNFCNKLWNVARYIESAGHPSTALGVKGTGEPNRPARWNARESGPAQLIPHGPADHWILNKLSILTDRIDKDLTGFKFGEAYQNLYHFIWDDLADWYVEASKQSVNVGVLRSVLDSTLVLMHPFAPFVTETIWKQFGHEEMLAKQQLMPLAGFDKTQADKFEQVKQIVSAIRHLSAVTGVNKPTLWYQESKILEEQSDMIIRLGRLNGINKADGSRIGGVSLVGLKDNCWLDIDQKTAQAYADKLKQQVYERSESVKRLEGRLANNDYTSKAPSELIEQTRQDLESEKEILKNLSDEQMVFTKSLG